MTSKLSLLKWRRTRLGRPVVRLWRILIVGAELAALASLVACEDGPDPLDPSRLPVAVVEVGAPQLELAAGAQVTLTATPRSEEGTALPNRPITWASEDTTVLLVSPAGVVTGRRAGSARVSATAEGRSGSALLTVTTNPVPVPEHMEPWSALAGSGPSTLTLVGRDFVPGSRLSWNGAERAAVVVTSRRLTAQLTAADLAQADTVQVRVVNPGPGGGASQPLEFVISPRPVAAVRVEPEVASVNPGETVQFQAVALDATGGELGGRAVAWEISGDAAILLDPSGLVIGGVPGFATVTATIEGVSGSAELTVTYPVPAIDSLSPDSATEGSGDLTLTVWGHNFSRASVARWNGQDRPTTFIRGIELRVDIPATDLAAAGTASVTVHNPAPGGGSSGANSFTIRQRVHSVEVTGGPHKVWVGESTSFIAIPRDRDGNALPRPVAWSSSDSTVARVDTTGAVTTLKVGSAVITASTEGTAAIVGVSASEPPAYDVVYEGYHAGWPELWLQSPGANPVPRRILPEGFSAHDPAVSPDGTRIAFVGRGESWNWDIWVVDRDGTSLQRLTSGPEAEDQPAWSPDGTRIVFRSDREGASDVWVMNADGTGQVNLTRNQWRFGMHTSNTPAWGPNSRIVFADGDMGMQPFRSVLRSMNPDGTDWRVIADDPAFSYGDPAFSPDGQYLAVRQAAAQGGSFVNVMGPNGEPFIWAQLPVAGGAPAWSPDGRWLAVSRLEGMGPCTCELFLVDMRGLDHLPLSHTEGMSAGRNPAWLVRP